MPWSPAPSSLLPAASTPWAMSDGLGVQVAGDLRLVPAEPVLVVADVVDRHAGQMGQQVGRDRGRAAGLAGEHHAVGGDQRLAGDARVRVGREIGVQHRVAEPVGDLVGMAFGDGLGGEQEFARIAHGWFLSRRGGLRQRKRPLPGPDGGAVCGGNPPRGQGSQTVIPERSTRPRIASLRDRAGPVVAYRPKRAFIAPRTGRRRAPWSRC